MIFDLEAATEAKLDGMARAYEHAPSDWITDAHAVVYRLAHSQPEFTADDVWRILWRPPEPRVLGPVLRVAAIHGLITKSGRQRNSARPVHHATPLTIWRSLVYPPTVTL